MSDKVKSSSKCIGLLFLPHVSVEKYVDLQKSDLILEEVYRYKLMASVSKSSPLARKSVMSFDEFFNHPLSLYNLPIKKFFDIFFKGRYTPNIILNSTNIHLCMDAIAKGLAIGLTDGLLEKYLGNKNVVPVPFKEDIDMVLLCMTSAEMLKKNSVKEFLRVLKSKAAV